MIKLIDEYKAQPETVAWVENNRPPLTDPQQKFTRKVRFRSFLDTSIIKRHLHSLSYLLNWNIHEQDAIDTLYVGHYCGEYRLLEEAQSAPASTKVNVFKEILENHKSIFEDPSGRGFDGRFTLRENYQHKSRHSGHPHHFQNHHRGTGSCSCNWHEYDQGLLRLEAFAHWLWWQEL